MTLATQNLDTSFPRSTSAPLFLLHNPTTATNTTPIPLKHPPPLQQNLPLPHEKRAQRPFPHRRAQPQPQPLPPPTRATTPSSSQSLRPRPLRSSQRTWLSLRSGSLRTSAMPTAHRPRRAPVEGEAAPQCCETMLVLCVWPPRRRYWWRTTWSALPSDEHLAMAWSMPPGHLVMRQHGNVWRRFKTRRS